ncbi:MAG TPA: fatty acid desaturase [Thermoanaerobaculia bacterium]|nr:fatty acid desaturase [Thermoanaerobaculia bacterium]
MSETRPPINWTTALFLVGSFAVAVVGTPLYLWRFGAVWFDLAHFVTMAWVTGLSITVGYHRLYAHRSFDAAWPVRLATLAFGAAAFEASALGWASEHRYHHRFTDRDGHPYDPHSIERGFFHAHMGWLLRYRQPALPLSNVADLAKDPLVAWQHRWFVPLAAGFGLGLPAAVGAAHAAWSGGSLAVGALGGFLIGGCARLVAVHHATFLINSLAHTMGRQPYDSSQSSRDSAILAFFTFGEGYHNFHHAFQSDYRNGVRPWHWDPGKWAIWMLSKVGLARNLRRTRPETILMAKVEQARLVFEKRLAAAQVELSDQAAAVLRDLNERLDETYRRFRLLYAEHAKLAKRPPAEQGERYEELRRELQRMRRSLVELARACRARQRRLLSPTRAYGGQRIGSSATETSSATAVRGTPTLT